MGRNLRVIRWTVIFASLPLAAFAQETQKLRNPAQGEAVTLFRPDLSDEEVLGLKRDHPLAPALEMALDGHRHIENNIRDYSCILVRRERVDGRLGDFEYIQAKVRHERRKEGRVVTPFAVYLKFLGPASVKGREVLYVRGRNDDRMRVRRGGPRFGYVTAWISPHGEIAMKGNRYPVTEMGVKNMVRRLIELARSELGRDVCRVSFAEDASIDDRDCTCIQVTRPAPSDPEVSQIARVFIDDELGIPVHFESRESSPGGQGTFELIEQYTFRQVRLNVGFSDADFDVENPAYLLK